MKMKRPYFTILMIIITAVFSGCGKSGTSPSKTNTGTTTQTGTTTTQYPVTSTFVQTGGTPITYKHL
ncbi:hypothetical protein FO440_15005 [Mucilaginibacter corticis]|uniref:Uncharacterized protein n=1 Tax=Mucilaginibacter corticis TaxID=2597670 RepID=A0A556MM97_9SPHI|nr:hypothetical protein [Mucilaginibacter corticis]TSJ41040.1 hypothetical protein FO440_15005 [Mucilaginibacter corticis]